MRGKIIAVLVMLTSAGVLAWHHRADLIPAAAPPPDPAEAAFLACFAERSADIDRMVADAVIQPSQAETFKARAEALCRDQAAQH